MQVFREPKNFETEKWNYLSIGYHKGKAIVKNELGELFFMECEEEVAPIGTVVTADLLTTIEKLPETEYQEIKKRETKGGRCRQ